MALGGAGPLAERELAYLERTLVRLEHRRQGLATALLRRAIQPAIGIRYAEASGAQPASSASMSRFQKGRSKRKSSVP